jgi:hypothetical protein
VGELADTPASSCQLLFQLALSGASGDAFVSTEDIRPTVPSTQRSEQFRALAGRPAKVELSTMDVHVVVGMVAAASSPEPTTATISAGITTTAKFVETPPVRKIAVLGGVLAFFVCAPVVLFLFIISPVFVIRGARMIGGGLLRSVASCHSFAHTHLSAYSRHRASERDTPVDSYLDFRLELDQRRDATRRHSTLTSSDSRSMHNLALQEQPVGPHEQFQGGTNFSIGPYRLAFSIDRRHSAMDGRNAYLINF